MWHCLCWCAEHWCVRMRASMILWRLPASELLCNQSKTVVSSWPLLRFFINRTIAFGAPQLHATLLVPFFLDYTQRVLVEGFKPEESFKSILSATAHASIACHSSIVYMELNDNCTVNAGELIFTHMWYQSTALHASPFGPGLNPETVRVPLWWTVWGTKEGRRSASRSFGLFAQIILRSMVRMSREGNGCGKRELLIMFRWIEYVVHLSFCHLVRHSTHQHYSPLQHHLCGAQWQPHMSS